jgi:hypothetical protein
MNRLITFIVVALFCTNGAIAQQRINDIRKAYAEAKEIINQHNTDNCTTGVNHLQLITEENVPGSGKCTRTVDFYYKLNEYNPSTDNYSYTLYFVSVKYTYAGNRPELYEYLIDTDNLKLMFVYNNFIDIDGNKVEKRVYYNADGNVIRYLDTSLPNPTFDEGIKMFGVHLQNNLSAYITMFRAVLTNSFTGEAPTLQGDE